MWLETQYPPHEKSRKDGHLLTTENMRGKFDYLHLHQPKSERAH